MAKRKKKKQQRTTTFTWEQNHSLTIPAHPVYVDLDAMLKAIDAVPGSEEDKKAEKEVATFLAFMADENGEVRLDDELITLPTMGGQK